MRTLTLTLPLVAALLAACDHSPTEPMKAAAKPDKLLLFSSGWIRYDLPFRPTGMNDAGLIVGQKDSDAVVYQNGTLTRLARAPGVSGHYYAYGITPKGRIYGSGGSGNGHGLFWLLPTAAPYDMSMDPFRGFVQFDPNGMNDDLIAVGTTYGLPFGSPDNSVHQAVQWTPSLGFKNISLSSGGGYAYGINASGYAAGSSMLADGSVVPVRWDANGVPTQLSATNGGAGSINSNGDVLGFTEIGNTTVWHLDGTATVYAGFWGAVALSSAGRFVGNDANNGLPFTLFNGTLTEFSTPTPASLPPSVVAVNTCGNLIAYRRDVPDAGYLWMRGGLTPVCDGTTGIASVTRVQHVRSE